jgi:hypothetical protein
MTAPERRSGAAPGAGGFLHDDEASALKMLHEARGDDPRHHRVGVARLLAANEAQRLKHFISRPEFAELHCASSVAGPPSSDLHFVQ